MPSPSIDQDQELAEFFTDVEHLRGAFKDAVAAPALTKRLFVIHGVGGVGKSSLLRMFRLHCKGVNVPVALASGDEAKSVLDALIRWAADLKIDRIMCPTFGRTHEHYRALQAKVDMETSKIAGQAVKDVAKATIETAAGTIPGIGSLLGRLGGTSVEALADILMSRGFKRPDIDLLLDPSKKLADDFLNDIAKAADKRCIVLMLDTFEQMTALEDWTCQMVQRLPTNVLFVIAGRALPNWGRAWDSWQKNAYVEELKPMAEDVMRQLIQRYYATMRGGEPESQQVEAIIRFARGLPMVVTSAVQLWVKYGVEDFQTVKAEIAANLVDRLMEGVPNALIPALEVAACVRWFDQPILRAVMKRDDVRDDYNELRRFPFVRVRAEGLALHDAVREIMDENLRAQDSERHGVLHVRAAIYFEGRLEKATGEETERLVLERLYHHILGDEETGIKLFQEMAEELTQYRLVNRLRVLLNDAVTYPLERMNSSLWRDYYKARLAHLEAKYEDAAKMYRLIGTKGNAQPQLRSYALADLGRIQTRNENLSKSDGVSIALNVFQLSKELAVVIDSKLISAWAHMTGIYSSLGEWNKVLEITAMSLAYHLEKKDCYAIIEKYVSYRWAYGMVGDWAKARDAHLSANHWLQKTSSQYLTAYVEGAEIAYMLWSGDYFNVEQGLKRYLRYAEEVNLEDAIPGILRDLMLVLGLQGKHERAASYHSNLEADYSIENGWIAEAAIAQGYWGTVLLHQGKLDDAELSLESSIYLKTSVSDKIGTPELFSSLGKLNEMRGSTNGVNVTLPKSESYYLKAIDYCWAGRRHIQCGALTGLVRVKHAQVDYAAIPPLITEAEQLAQQYEYNDHLASLRLTQAHVAWEGEAPTWDNGFEAALHFYQHALIYALRYNRFLLDEVLSGRPQGSPLRPIIPQCLERGEEGRQMLFALRDWWKTGVNDIGTPRPDTISPIPEGIPLLEAEHIAREREPGDGSPQKSVTEQIEVATG